MPLEGVITIGIIGTRTYPSAVRRKGSVENPSRIAFSSISPMMGEALCVPFASNLDPMVVLWRIVHPAPITVPSCTTVAWP